ncbi:hypothetical protein CMI42_01610 [Candidatus Pacearchaeota archaeon]|nr:hypothetical protein [Candidatus Pacearchaeota archaeon]
MSDKIKALFIFEILGRPKEHIKISLEQLIDRIGENKGVEIVNGKVHEPHLLDKDKNPSDKEIFSTFAEVEMEVDNLSLLFAIILNTLPSNIEILEPSELRLKNFDLTAVLSDLAVKLHKYDEIAKGMAMEKSQMLNIMREMNNKIVELGGESMVRFEDPKKVEDKKEEVGDGGNKSDESKSKKNDEVSLEDMEGVREEDDKNEERD